MRLPMPKQLVIASCSIAALWLSLCEASIARAHDPGLSSITVRESGTSGQFSAVVHDADLPERRRAHSGACSAGGVLLLWVCWKMWRELRTSHAEEEAATEALEEEDLNKDGTIAAGAPRKTFAQAAWQIVIADVSMSLDNVLAVAGAAREHPEILVFGLVLSIALMGIAASFIARLLHRHRWIAYVGLAIIFYVALEMIYRGGVEIMAFAGS